MKRIVIFVVLILVGLAAWFGLKEYNRKNKDLAGEQAALTINAADLIAAFEKDSASANKTYVDKVVAVTGRVNNINTDGNPVIITLGEEGKMSTVQCSMDSTHASDYKSIAVGGNAKLKGMCTGAFSDPMFGTNVQLNRCVIQK
ncbi:MAG: hypothetical protein C4329_04965 [Chitinophagaceae bacterium]